MSRLQIGVMGSMSDLQYEKEFEVAAEKVGQLIAERYGILFFGAEKDSDSLSTAACRGAKRAGGLTVGITYGKGKEIWQKDADIIIPFLTVEIDERYWEQIRLRRPWSWLSKRGYFFEMGIQVM